MSPTLPLSLLLTIPLLLTSCGDPDPSKAPTRDTPTGAKVDLTDVSLSVEEASIEKTSNTLYELRFEYTINNSSGSNIQLPSVYPNMDHLIEVTVTDKDAQLFTLERNSLEGLTLAQPNPKRILVGKTTRSYKVKIAPNDIQEDDLVSVRIRLHVPSRYDELRSTLEAHTLSLVWPGEPKRKKR